MKIDINFNFYSDSNGRDPDRVSKTLREYHKILWSKNLPCGNFFELAKKSNSYLYHKSSMGEFFLGSDAIINSYRHSKRKSWLYKKIPKEMDELFDIGSTIGGYIIFPSNKIAGFHTINQGRGVNNLIDDRFDLTLECIRLFYLNEKSPLYNILKKYENFFYLFENFEGYVKFFLLDDLIKNKKINFFLPFNNFDKPVSFSNTDEYLIYKKNVISFIKARNKRIEKYIKNN